MHSRIVRVAAALAVVGGAAGLVMVFSSQAKPTFAQVVGPFLTARSATYSFTVVADDKATPQSKVMFLEPGRFRHLLPGGMVHIMDTRDRQALILFPDSKTAIRQAVSESMQTSNPFLELRGRIKQALADGDQSVRYLGDREIDGRRVLGYRVENTRTQFTVWADAKSKLPVGYDMSSREMPEQVMVVRDIVFDVPLEESLFSVEVPAGYTLADMPVSALGAPVAEQDLVIALRAHADITGGQFPAALDETTVGAFLALLEGGAIGSGLTEVQRDQLRFAMPMALSRGLAFVRSLPPDSDVHYVGPEVRLGQGDKPLFWYRPAGSAAYRVIYGDLSAKDLAAGEVPGVAGEQP